MLILLDVNCWARVLERKQTVRWNHLKVKYYKFVEMQNKMQSTLDYFEKSYVIFKKYDLKIMHNLKTK